MVDLVSPPVVVAVGDGPAEAALAWAASRAVEHGCGLHLVHVVRPAASGPPPSMLEIVDRGQAAGRTLLAEAADRARSLVGGTVPVHTELAVGGVVPELGKAAADACMVVLQHRELSALRRVVTRSVTSGLAARSRAPVVSVPETWPAQRPLDRVTVALAVPSTDEVLVQAALAAVSPGGQSPGAAHPGRRHLRGGRRPGSAPGAGGEGRPGDARQGPRGAGHRRGRPGAPRLAGREPPRSGPHQRSAGARTPRPTGPVRKPPRPGRACRHPGGPLSSDARRPARNRGRSCMKFTALGTRIGTKHGPMVLIRAAVRPADPRPAASGAWCRCGPTVERV